MAIRKKRPKPETELATRNTPVERLEELREAANAERSRVREIGRERQEAEETRRAARERLVEALSRGEDGAVEQRSLEKAEAQAAKR